MKEYYIFLLLMTVSFSSCDSGSSDDSTGPDIDPPLSAMLLYPPNGYEGMGRSPSFIWVGRLQNDSDGSYRFTLELGVSGSSDRMYFHVERDTIFHYPDTLDADTEYSCRVKTEASGDRIAFSGYRSFTTGTGFNNPPAMPTVIYPPKNGKDIPPDITFLWSGYDPDGDVLTYDLWYRRAYESDSIHVSGLTEPEHHVFLDADTNYSYVIYAFDEHDAMNKCFLTGFATAITTPPHDPFPTDGAVDQPTDIILSWSCTDPDGDDLTYDVQMGRAGGSMSVIGDGLTQDELPVVGLSEGVRYEWKVTAEDDDDHRTEGPVWSFTTIGGSDVVFADLTLTRTQNYGVVVDNIWARFDETYAPQWALRWLRPDTVICRDLGLYWQESSHRFYYENAYTLSFLNPGTEYTFTVTPGDGVPALTESIIFPQCAPLIISPGPSEFVSMDGFEVTWSGYNDFTDCDRQISIAILDMSGDSLGVYVTTENDGSYTFTAGELSVIDPAVMDLQIVLIVENIENIDSPGYDPRSWIRARTISVQYVYQN